MRIVQVCPRYSPQTGGVETHVREVSEHLVKRGHDVTVHTADAGRGGELVEQRGGVQIRRHRAFAPREAIHFAPGVISALCHEDADIIHAHNYHSIPLHFAALSVDETRFVATPHYHGASAHRLRNWLLQAYRPAGRLVLRRADVVVAVSEWEQERLTDDFGVNPTVVPNGIDVQRFAEAEPEMRDRPYLLCVGRLEGYKGFQDVIEALPLLPEYELIMAGEGPARAELESLAADSGVANRVTFLGEVSEDRLPRLYAGATAYLNMSRFEAFGLTVGEALAAGTPCVVADNGGLKSWTGKSGVVASQSTRPDDIAAAMKSAIGSTVSVSLPTWNDTVDRLLILYESA